MPIHKDFQPVYSQKSEINFLQCYPGGILKYTDLCNLLQLTAGEHAALGGLSFSDMHPFHQAWVLQKMQLTIFELPKWKEVVSLETYVIKMEHGKSIRVINMHKNKKQLVRAITHWLVMDTQKRKSTALALPFEHFLNHNLLLDFEDYTHVLETVSFSENSKTKNIELSDLDILAHANNVKYLEWCLNFYTSEQIIKHPIVRLDMQFIRELKEQDLIKIHQKKGENQTLFEITKNEKISFILRIEHKKNLPKEV